MNALTRSTRAHCRISGESAASVSRACANQAGRVGKFEDVHLPFQAHQELGGEGPIPESPGKRRPTNSHH